MELFEKVLIVLSGIILRKKLFLFGSLELFVLVFILFVFKFEGLIFILVFGFIMFVINRLINRVNVVIILK